MACQKKRPLCGLKISQSDKGRELHACVLGATTTAVWVLEDVLESIALRRRDARSAHLHTRPATCSSTFRMLLCPWWILGGIHMRLRTSRRRRGGLSRRGLRQGRDLRRLWSHDHSPQRGRPPHRQRRLRGHRRRPTLALRPMCRGRPLLVLDLRPRRFRCLLGSSLLSHSSNIRPLVQRHHHHHHHHSTISRRS